MTTLTALVGARIFDGTTLHRDRALLFQGGRILGLPPATAIPPRATVHDLPGGILAPGYVDLQVNGGGGVMFNDAPSVQTLATIAAAHAALGATTILPTLISDTARATEAAIDAAADAIAAGVPGIAGLHLEGPHLTRAGAHDPACLRPMQDTDLTLLCQAARRLPVLKLTLAPERASAVQIAALTRAGALISLGHTEAGYAAALEAVRAGARAVTHLFNAMGGIAGREPGLAGAALDRGALSAGLIADGIHVHPATIAAALRAKRGPGRIFLISDAMAVAGTDLDRFDLNGRAVLRRDGRLTLADGTLAGADLDLTRAIRVLVRDCGTPLETALEMAGPVPAALAGIGAGRLAPGLAADIVHLDADALALRRVWQHGAPRLP